MTYDRRLRRSPHAVRYIDASVSHLAELVRGNLAGRTMAPSPRPSPQGERGPAPLRRSIPRWRGSDAATATLHCIYSRGEPISLERM